MSLQGGMKAITGGQRLRVGMSLAFGRVWAGGLFACVLAVAIGARAAESVPVKVESDTTENAVILLGDVRSDRLVLLPETYTVARRYPDGHPMNNALAGAVASCSLEETKEIYSAKLGTFAFRPGRGRRIADDLITELVRDCSICSLTVRVSGGVEDGDGVFLADFSLYDGCPAAGHGGLEIPGTRLRFRDLPDDAGLFHDLILDYSDRGICDDGSSCLVSQQNCTGGTCADGSTCDTEIPTCVDESECVSSGFVCVEDPLVIPATVWVRLRFDTDDAVIVMGSPPTRGFSADAYDDPQAFCTAWFAGWPTNPHASLYSEILAPADCETHFLAYLAANPNKPPFLPSDLGPIPIPGGGTRPPITSPTTRLGDDIRLAVDNCTLSAYELGIKGNVGEYHMQMDLRWPDVRTVQQGTVYTFIGRGEGSTEVAHVTIDEDVILSIGPNDQPIVMTWQSNRANTGAMEVNITQVGTSGPDMLAYDVDPQNPNTWMLLGDGDSTPAVFYAAIFCRGDTPRGACCPDQPDIPASEMNCFDDVPVTSCLGNRWLADTTCDENLFDPPCGTHACCLPDGSCENVAREECLLTCDTLSPPIECQTDLDCPGERTCETGGGCANSCTPPCAEWRSGKFCGDANLKCPQPCEITRPMFPPTEFAVDTRPYSVAIGDLDGDRVPDLVVANNSSHNISVLLGVCDGTYAAAVNYAAGTRPISVAIGDLNGDQVPDVAVANSGSDNVSVLMGVGDGTFAAAANYAADDGSNAVSVGDLNGDQLPDLAVANILSDNVSVLLGVGNGTFAPAKNYAADDGPSSVAVGDLNGDQVTDLAVTNVLSDNVSVLLGVGDGTFVAAVQYAVGEYPSSVAIGDLNGDLVPDVAVANQKSSNVSVLLGVGDGTFAAAMTYVAGVQPVFVAIGDLDRDQVPDLAVANRFSNNISVLLGVGDGTFAAAVHCNVGSAPQTVAIGDLNWDQVPDLVVTNILSDNVSVLLGVGDGTFAAGLVRYAVGEFPDSVAIGDLDGDLVPDLASANSLSDNVSVLLGLGDGKFAAPARFAAGDGPGAIAISDLDGDLVPDLAVVNSHSDQVTVLMGIGAGSFPAAVHYAAGVDPRFVAIGDLDGDLVPDLAVANADSDNVSVLLGVGDGTFAAAAHYAAGDLPSTVAIGDLDGDQVPDMAVTNWRTHDVSVLLGIGDGTFAAAEGHAVGNRPGSVAIGDLDGDQVPDLAVANWGSNNVSVLLGVGDGTFASEAHFAVGIHPTTVAIGDLDGDQVPDLVTASFSRDNGSVLLGVGNGMFADAVPYAAGNSPAYVAIGDLNGDQMLDLAVANSLSDNVSVLLNQSSRGCNGNGIPDDCDTDCGPPGGTCDRPGCGQSEDCNGNGEPDECETDCDDDGFIDDCDACIDSELAKLIVLNECPTGVPNGLLDDGCTMNDVLSECSVGAHSHGELTACLARLANEWRREGLLSGKDVGRIVRCAGASNEPRPSKRSKDVRTRGRG